LDQIAALELHKGNKSLFYMILNHFRNQSLIESIDIITNAFNESKWTKMKEAAHTLKGTSGYVGASTIHYDCYFMQESFL